LTAEYCPERNRAKLVLIMSTGFTFGALVAGAVAASIIPDYGWRAVWYIGGGVPLLFVPVQWFLLPESIGFLVVTEAVPARIGALLQHIDKGFRLAADTRYALAEARAPGVPIVHLFREGRAVGTLLLWLVFFLNLFDFFLLTNWLPTLTNAAGLPMQAAIVAGAMFMVGGIVAAWFLGFPMDRFGSYGVLTILYAAGFVILLMLSYAGTSYAALLALIFGTGFCVAGGQNSVNALSAIFYPVSMRSTGVGWAFGIGRIGAIIGPLTAGFLVSSQWGNSPIFIVAAIAMFVAAVAVFIMGRICRPATTARIAPTP
jgi:AAHS family 4-hydroxybenzoate transporter-like MFS transporter